MMPNPSAEDTKARLAKRPPWPVALAYLPISRFL